MQTTEVSKPSPTWSNTNVGCFPEYQDCNDGYGVSFEIATINTYRFYNYSCFKSQHNIWQAQNIKKIIQLIEKEFNFKLYQNI
jgi:hypothetical protein